MFILRRCCPRHIHQVGRYWPQDEVTSECEIEVLSGVSVRGNMHCEYDVGSKFNLSSRSPLPRSSLRFLASSFLRLYLLARLHRALIILLSNLISYRPIRSDEPALLWKNITFPSGVACSGENT